MTAHGGEAFPFSASFGTHEERDASLLAIPFESGHLSTDPREDKLIPTDPTDGCWTVDYTLVSTALGIAGTLAPEEVHRMRYTVLGYDNESCLPST